MRDEEILFALPKPVVVVSATLDISYANPAFVELLGGASDDLQWLSSAVRSAPALSTSLRRAIAKLRTIGWSADCRWTTGTDEPRVFDVRVTRTTTNDYLAVFDDASQYVRIQEIQSRARTYLESVLNHLHLGVIVLDGDFQVTFFNNDQAELFRRMGVERSLFDVIGAPISESYPIFSPAEWADIHTRVAISGEHANWPRISFPHGHPIGCFMVNLVPLAREGNRLPGAICITDDVTSTVALEQELIEKERLALIGQMTIALNHEINNPLTAILGTAESLLFTGTLNQQQVPPLETIRDSALRIVDVTRRLRKIEEIQLTPYVDGGPMMLDLHAVRN